MNYLYVFVASYFLTFILAWYMAARRVARASRVLREQGMSDRLIDEYYVKMSKPVWLFSIWFTATTGSIAGLIASILLAIFS